LIKETLFADQLNISHGVSLRTNEDNCLVASVCEQLDLL